MRTTVPLNGCASGYVVTVYSVATWGYYPGRTGRNGRMHTECLSNDSVEINRRLIMERALYLAHQFLVYAWVPDEPRYEPG
jgi:hypothetical protein